MSARNKARKFFMTMFEWDYRAKFGEEKKVGVRNYYRGCILILVYLFGRYKDQNLKDDLAHFIMMFTRDLEASYHDLDYYHPSSIEIRKELRSLRFYIIKNIKKRWVDENTNS